MRFLRPLTRWETGLVVMIVIVILVGQATSPGLLSTYNLQTMAINNSVLACLAFGVAPVIIAADIDISIAAMLALCGVIMAKLWGGGMNIWLAALLGEAAVGPLRVIDGAGHRFLDHPLGHISVINLASLRDLEARLGRPVDPLRFRANLYVEGWPAWAGVNGLRGLMARPVS